MVRDKAEKQKQKAKEMLGISDNRAKEIFEKQEDRKQQKKKKLQQKQKEKGVEKDNTSEQPDEAKDEDTGKEEEEVEITECPECGDEFDSERGMKIHKSQKH